ncbi:MAG: hypothetical protein SGPRY_000820 [Prymnesium sp.]
MQEPKGSKGYYARPSAAFEQGGGFYVPGLEGAKLRLAAASLLSLALLLNRFLSPGQPASSQLYSELLGALGVSLLFAQVATQARLESERERLALRAAIAARVKEQKQVSDQLSRPVAEAATWAADTLLRLTPALGIVWLLDEFTLSSNSPNGSADEKRSAHVSPFTPFSILTALNLLLCHVTSMDELRVVLKVGRFPEEPADLARESPETLTEILGSARSADYELDPGASESACAPLPSNTMSALLHRCGPAGVLAIASERPSAFNDKHRTWLASMARYLEQAMP